MNSITRSKDSLSWLWLALAAVLLPFFALGYRNIAIAAWFAPVFLLRFTRTARRVVSALMLVFLVHGVVYTLASYNEFFGWSISLLLALFFASAHTLSYLADRLLVARLPCPLLRSLVFPLTFAVVDWLMSFGFFYVANWASPAYGSDAILMMQKNIAGERSLLTGDRMRQSP